MDRERGPGDSGGGGKTKKKEKGYKTVGLDTSEDDDDAAMIMGSQSAAKSKPKPTFRLKKKKSFKDKAAECRDRKTDESVERTKIKRKISNNNPFSDHAGGDVKHSHPERSVSKDDTDTQIFAIPLVKAVEIDRCPDGTNIPAFFRVCVNYIEDNGLDTIGIYRTSGSQSKIQELKQHFNRGNRVRLNDYDVATVADVMKLFIRELPHRLLPEELIPDLEEAIELPDVAKRASSTAKVLTKLEASCRALLGWIFVHMTHIMDHQEHNKMPLKNVALVLEPTLRIQSNKVLNFLLTHAIDVFPDVKITKTSAAEEGVTEPEILIQLREELSKKEVLLNHLHHEIKQGKASKRKEEQLWDIQRQVTELKRKIRTYEKMTTVNIGQEKAEKASKNTSHPSLKPKPAIRTAVINKPAEKDAPIKVDDQVPETNAKDEVIDEVRRKEMINELIQKISLYEALQSHNKSLREKITKESEALARIQEEIQQLNNPYQPQTIEESEMDRDAMMKEMSNLMEKYNMHKAMSAELTDAICSETSGWIAVVAEVNSRKARQALVGNLI